jgi:hypothetical protein
VTFTLRHLCEAEGIHGWDVKCAVWELKSLHRTDFSKAGLFRELGGQLLRRGLQPLIIITLLTFSGGTSSIPPLSDVAGSLEPPIALLLSL